MISTTCVITNVNQNCPHCGCDAHALAGPQTRPSRNERPQGTHLSCRPSENHARHTVAGTHHIVCVRKPAHRIMKSGPSTHQHKRAWCEQREETTTCQKKPSNAASAPERRVLCRLIISHLHCTDKGYSPRQTPLWGNSNFPNNTVRNIRITHQRQTPVFWCHGEKLISATL